MLRRCLGCNKLTTHSRCGSCRRKSYRVYNAPEYKHNRMVALARDGYRCQVPKRDGSLCLKPAWTVDHIKPVSKGGTHHPSNLRAACLQCNSGKRDR